MSLVLASPLPKGAEYLADIAAKVAPQGGVSPYLLLGILYAESNFGMALKPTGPSGSGDFIARPTSPDRDKRMASNPLPGVVKKTLAEGIKARKIAGPCEAWVPTTNGWGCGLFQIDYEAHYEFCKSGQWTDPEKACAYAVGILKSARSSLVKLVPGISGVNLDRAMIASYNAGAGRVSKFLKEGKSLDDCTFHPGYVDKICNKADALAGHSGSWMTVG
jgi:hypothetical protein